MNPSNPNQPVMPGQNPQQQFPNQQQPYPMQNPTSGQGTCPAYTADHGGIYLNEHVVL